MVLDGNAPAAAIRAAALERANAFSVIHGRRPALAAVAVDAGPMVPLYFDAKARAFDECGVDFQPHILSPASSTHHVIERIESLNASSTVDAIFVQYPMPVIIDSQVTYDMIAAGKDVDGAADPARGASVEHPFMPATAHAVLRLLSAYDIPMNGMHVCIVRGDAVFARALSLLFEREGATATVVDLPGSGAKPRTTPATIHTADIVVVCTGVVNGISAAAFRDGAVVVDVGYYHGGGRGDISAHPDDIARLSAYAGPRGSIGPLTVAILIEHTISAAGINAGRRMDK